MMEATSLRALAAKYRRLAMLTTDEEARRAALAMAAQFERRIEDLGGRCASPAEAERPE
jgi:hypothetical protein